MNIRDLLSITTLDDLIAQKYITRIHSPSGYYYLYNYTEKTTYDRLWCLETLECRGLVTMTDGTIVARPFQKFSNINEAGFPDNNVVRLLERPGPVEFTEKLDGSLIIIWYDPINNDWRCTTRGSFTSTQARDAAHWLQIMEIQGTIIPLSAWPTVFTLLAEWCAPSNRVVLRYEQAGLHLIGVRTPQGYDADYEHLLNWSAVIGLPLVPAFTESDLAGLVDLARTTTGVEGWVARWPDGHRVKIKTDDYMALHRIISKFSPKRVHEAMIEGAFGRYLMELPEELRPEAERIYNAIQETCINLADVVETTFYELQPLLAESRKVFALAAIQEEAWMRPYLFLAADRKPVREKILKDLDINHLFAIQEEVSV